MKFFKKFLTKVFYISLKLPFTFWNFNAKNLKNIKTFHYLQNDNEIVDFNRNNYYVYNKRKSFDFLSFKKIKLNKYYYCNIDKIYAVSAGDYPIFISNKLRIILESINLNLKYIYSSQFFKCLFKLIFNKPNKNFNNVICFAGSLNDNKFHWLIDYLPRLEYVVKNNLQNEYEYIVNKHNINFIRYYLKTLGISDKNIYLWNDTIANIENLHIYSSRYIKLQNNKYSLYSPKSILWLNSYFKKKFDYLSINYKYKKVVILRKKNDLRNIINENEFINFLTKFDYDFIYLEDFEEEKIVEIFNSIEVLITIHGAALSNIIFSKNIKIIEIFPDSRPEEDEFVYYQLSKILNFPHHVFVVDKNNCHNGIYINIELFKKTLENIL